MSSSYQERLGSGQSEPHHQIVSLRGCVEGAVGGWRYGPAPMVEPVRLPRASEATIPTAKLVSYALDPTHERGQHKARVFASALGITNRDWRYLHDQILDALPDGVVRSTRITPFGVAYEVIVTIDGLNGRTASVVTTWILTAGAPPQLTSTWVDIP